MSTSFFADLLLKVLTFHQLLQLAFEDAPMIGQVPLALGYEQ